MSKQNDHLEKELSQAGEASSLSPLVVKLDKYRIMPDTDVPAEDFLMRMYGKPCFPRRDLSTVTGVEKCGKTFFTSMLMACCAKKNVLEMERVRDEPLKVMWYDTEQNPTSTKSILKDRVEQMVEEDFPEDKFFAFNVRACTYEERMDYLVTGIETYKPDMVIIDNVSDLLQSVNDSDASIKLIDQLMQLSTLHNCNITVVIHLNRSGDKRNLRGWLGTEIQHKAFEVYYCEQIEKTDVFSVEQTLTRKYRISETLYYKINAVGLPEISEKPDYQPRGEDGRFRSKTPDAYQIKSNSVKLFNQDYIIWHEDDARHPWDWNLRKLFEDAMGGRASMSLDDLQKEAMAISGIKQPKYYEKVFNLAVEMRVVKTTMERNGRVIVITIPS